MKSVLEWHALQDGFIRLLEQTKFSVRLVLLRPGGRSLLLAVSVCQKSAVP